MPSVFINGGLLELAYTVGTTSTTPSDAYDAWATSLGVSTTATLQALDADDQGFAITLASSFFSGGGTTGMFSSEAALGVYLATPPNTGSSAYTISNISRMYGLTSRPKLLLSFHPANDLRSEGVKIQRSGSTTIIYSTHRQYNATAFRYQAAIRITPQSIEFVGFAQDNATPLYLNELSETTTTVLQQQVLATTSDVGVITTLDITVADAVPEGILSDSGPLRQPSVLGVAEVSGYISDTGPLGQPSIVSLVTIPGYIAVDGPLGAVRVLARSQIVGQISMPQILGSVSCVAYHDFTQHIDDSRSIWVMDLETPGGLVRVPISSWQSTQQTDSASYAQCVIPAVTDWIATLTDATEFVISRVVTLPDGSTLEYEFVRAPTQTVAINRGRSNATATVSGYTDAVEELAELLNPIYDRTLTGIRTISSVSGNTRARTSIDWLLRPGMRAIVDGGAIVVRYINYYSPAGFDQYMDIGDRGNG